MKAISSKLLTIACASALLLSFSGSVSAQELMLTKGTKSLGGNLTLDIDYFKPSGGDGASEIGLNAGLNAGYFFMDNVRAVLSVNASYPFKNDITGSAKTLTVGVGADYYFSGMGRLVPFIGGRVGMANINGGSNEFGVNIGLPFGVLVPMSSNVALSLGVRTSFDIYFGDNKSTYMKFPIGFLGVEAFF